jgi:hypothetical protein
MDLAAKVKGLQEWMETGDYDKLVPALAEMDDGAERIARLGIIRASDYYRLKILWEQMVILLGEKAVNFQVFEEMESVMLHNEPEKIPEIAALWFSVSPTLMVEFLTRAIRPDESLISIRKKIIDSILKLSFEGRIQLRKTVWELGDKEMVHSRCEFDHVSAVICLLEKALKLYIAFYNDNK